MKVQILRKKKLPTNFFFFVLNVCTTFLPLFLINYALFISGFLSKLTSRTKFCISSFIFFQTQYLLARRKILKLHGEQLQSAIPHIGLLHRGTKKLTENKTLLQGLPYKNRLNYVSMLVNEHVCTLANEKFLFLGISLRAQFQYLRTLFDEITWLLNHLIVITAHVMHVGALTLFSWVFAKKKEIMKFYRKKSFYCTFLVFSNWITIFVCLFVFSYSCAFVVNEMSYYISAIPIGFISRTPFRNNSKLLKFNNKNSGIFLQKRFMQKTGLEAARKIVSNPETVKDVFMLTTKYIKKKTLTKNGVVINEKSDIQVHKKVAVQSDIDEMSKKPNVHTVVRPLVNNPSLKLRALNITQSDHTLKNVNIGTFPGSGHGSGEGTTISAKGIVGGITAVFIAAGVTDQAFHNKWERNQKGSETDANSIIDLKKRVAALESLQKAKAENKGSLLQRASNKTAEFLKLKRMKSDSNDSTKN